jgi:hypothetical protein
MSEERKRLYIVERTVTERFSYDPDEVMALIASRPLPWSTCSKEDRIIDFFEDVDGSVYGDRVFSSDANPSIGVELVEQWDDE